MKNLSNNWQNKRIKSMIQLQKKVNSINLKKIDNYIKIKRDNHFSLQKILRKRRRILRKRKLDKEKIIFL